MTAAARVLGRSQPAVSHALARLREALDDPLLVRQGRSLVPTPRAEALAGPVNRLLRDLRRTLSTGGDFDPATSRRRFSLACPDLLAPLVTDILAGLSGAPGVRLELLGERGAAAAAAADLVLDVLPDRAPGVVARPLGQVRQCVIARAHHPALAQPWTLEVWLGHPHVLVRTRDQRPSVVDRHLATVQRQRTIGLTVAHLLLAPHVVANSDLLFTGPEQILRRLAQPLGLVLLPHPLPLPAVPVAAMWAERLGADPGHRWFRERVVEAVITHMG